MANIQCNCGFNPDKHDGHSLRCALAINAVKTEAIEVADENLNNVGLPMYTDLSQRCDALREINAELLEALKELIADYDNGVTDTESVLLAKCRSAITKATGAA